MARTVTDAAILLGVIAGADPRDPATQGNNGKSFSDYTRFLDPGGLEGARIGIPRKYFGFNETVDLVINDAIEVIKRSGATVVDPVDLEQSNEYQESELEVLLFEFNNDLNKYLSERGTGSSVRSLKEIIEFNEKNRERVMPYFGQELFLKAEAKGPLTSPDYLKALEKNRLLSRTQGIDAVLAKDRLDAIVAPTGGPSWVTDLVNGDHYLGGSSSPAAAAGYPNINVPAGFIHALPVGISFFGAAYSEPTLIKISFAFEQATAIGARPHFFLQPDSDAASRLAPPTYQTNDEH